MAVKETCECSALDSTIKGTPMCSKIRLGWPWAHTFSVLQQSSFKAETFRLTSSAAMLVEKYLCTTKPTLITKDFCFLLVFQHTRYYNATGKENVPSTPWECWSRLESQQRLQSALPSPQWHILFIPPFSRLLVFLCWQTRQKAQDCQAHTQAQ